MGNCCGDIAGGRQAVGEAPSKGVMDGRLEVMEAVEQVTGLHGYVTQVELSFSAVKLRNKDLFSKSDPMLVVYTKKRDGTLEEAGRTEVVLNSLKPNWITEITMSYNFEEVQPLVLKVYDVDTKFSNIPSQVYFSVFPCHSAPLATVHLQSCGRKRKRLQQRKLKLSDQTHLGELECTLSEILTAPSQTFTRTLSREMEQLTEGAPDCGTLTIRAEETVKSKFLINMEMAAVDLDNKDLFSKSDPFLLISRWREDNSTTPAFKTEVKKNNLNPEWKPIKVTLSQLCNGDKDRPLKIECLNFNANGKADLIGEAQLSLNEIEQHAVERTAIDLQRRGHGPQHHIKNTGKLYVRYFSIEPYFSFLDYIAGGCEINFMVAVDFTASNGSPFQQDSLHYADPNGKPNNYQQSILAIGEVLQYYDTDKKFPAWGFGGRPIDGKVSHCFALNGNHSSADVDGINGILYAYSRALQNVALAGPTLFAPVINMATSVASQHVNQRNQKYFVLLIITDGVITDPQQTINALVRASHLPLSVLIIGVGGADFTEMEILDADKKRLATADGHLAQRDIVQFVPMRDVTKGSELAKMLLAELPYQFLEYMNEHKIVPGDRAPPPPHHMDPA